MVERIRASVVTAFTRYDLLNAEERIAEMNGFVERNRARLKGLPRDTDEAIWTGRVLASMERMLHQFQEHRSRIEDELKDTEARGQP